MENNYRGWSHSRAVLEGADLRKESLTLVVKSTQGCTVGICSAGGGDANRYYNVPASEEWQMVRFTLSRGRLSVLFNDHDVKVTSYGSAPDIYRPFVSLRAGSRATVRLPEEDSATTREDHMETLHKSAPELAEALASLPEVRDGLDDRDRKALASIRDLVGDPIGAEQELLDAVMHCQKATRRGFQRATPGHDCALQVLFWLGQEGRLNRHRELSLASALANGLFVLLCDGRVAEEIRQDTIDAFDFFMKTADLQERLGVPPLTDYPPTAKVRLVWRGGSLGSHAYSPNLREFDFYKWQKVPMPMTSYRRHVIKAKTLGEMQETVLRKGKPADSTRLAGIAYGMFSEKHWDFIVEDKPKKITVAGVPTANVWLGSATLIWERYKETGKGTGNCSDQNDARQALWKSLGLASSSVKMAFNNKMYGHIVPIFYCPEKDVWKGINTSQRPYKYYWALELSPVRYGDYIGKAGEFPREYSRHRGFEVISGQGVAGGRNEYLANGIPDSVFSQAIMGRKVEHLGYYIVKGPPKVKQR